MHVCKISFRSHFELSLLYDELRLFVFMYRLLDYYPCLSCALCCHTFISQMRFMLSCSLFCLTNVLASKCLKLICLPHVSEEMELQVGPQMTQTNRARGSHCRRIPFGGM